TGILDIGIVVGDTAGEIKASVGDGSKWSLHITYIYQTKPLGLAHAVNISKDFIQEDDFLMILGDNMFEMELDEIIKTFEAAGSNSTLLLHYVENPSEFGVAYISDNQIIKLVEKPEFPESNLAITGVYVFDKKIFEAISVTAPSPRGELEITDAIQNILYQGGSVTYKLTDGWWKDTGKLQNILEANQLLLKSKPGLRLSEPCKNCSLKGKVIIGHDVIIENSIINGPVIIGDHSVILNSSIGPNTSIGHDVTIIGTELENSIVLANSRFENVCKKIESSLIGKNAIIGSRVKPEVIELLIGDCSEVYI
ncbi:MAG: glucose-phosphate thymidylyltransferase, partial [Clostridiales bacterium]|nr:glucose-phosphate thymidylyltransferase [Clostridiales bacterium]